MGGELKGVAILLMVVLNALVLVRAQENSPSPSPQSNFKFGGSIGEAICSVECAKKCEFPAHLRSKCIAVCLIKCALQLSPSTDVVYTCTLRSATSMVSTRLQDKNQLDIYEELPQVANFIASLYDTCKEKNKNA